MTPLDRILNELKSKKISRNKMLKELGLAPNSFNNWISRGTSPTAETMAKMADYLSVSIDYIMYGDSDKAEPPEVQPTRQEINKLIDEMPEEKQEALLNLLKKL